MLSLKREHFILSTSTPLYWQWTLLSLAPLSKTVITHPRGGRDWQANERRGFCQDSLRYPGSWSGSMMCIGGRCAPRVEAEEEPHVGQRLQKWAQLYSLLRPGRDRSLPRVKVSFQGTVSFKSKFLLLQVGGCVVIDLLPIKQKNVSRKMFQYREAGSISMETTMFAEKVHDYWYVEY